MAKPFRWTYAGKPLTAWAEMSPSIPLART